MSKESTEMIIASHNIFAPAMIDTRPLPVLKFNRNCLIKNNSSAFGKLINQYILYTVDTWSRYLNRDFTLGNSSFGSVKLTENVDPDKHIYSGYGIEFGARSQL